MEAKDLIFPLGKVSTALDDFWDKKMRKNFIFFAQRIFWKSSFSSLLTSKENIFLEVNQNQNFFCWFHSADVLLLKNAFDCILRRILKDVQRAQVF